jgi:hypothetical protein
MSFTKIELDAVLALINKGDIEALKAEEFDQFQYQGFDPMRIVQSLLKIKTDKKIDDNDFKNDVIRMIGIAIIKGSITDKNLVKMSETGQNSVASLISKYGVEKNGGKGKASSVITFPRVMATFPDVSVRLAGVIGAKEFTGPLLSSRLPTCLKVQVFPAIIPRALSAETKKMLLTASLCYSIDQSIQISQIKEPNLKQLAADQAKFTMIGHQSPVPSSTVRIATFNGLSLKDNYAEIKSVLEDYIKQIDPSFIIPTKETYESQLKAIQ